MITLNAIATIIGFYSKLRLFYYGLVFHSVYCISIMGGFYLYTLIDFFLLYDERNKKANDPRRAGKYALSDSNVMLVYSLPLLGLFLMGLFSVYLLIKVDREIDERKL